MLPSQFLRDCAEWAPSSSRFVDYYYDAPVHLIYRGTVEQSSRGQQGCPLMGPLFCLTRARWVAEARTNCRRPLPEFEPEYTDDAFSGGDAADVLEAFHQELKLAEAYGIRFDLSKCTLYLLAGDGFRGDISGFQALGVRVVAGTDVVVLKAPVTGRDAFLEEFRQNKQLELERLYSCLEGLPQCDVALYLLRLIASFGRVQYLCRFAPRTFLQPLLDYCHDRIRNVIESILGESLMRISGCRCGCRFIWEDLELGPDVLSKACMSCNLLILRISPLGGRQGKLRSECCRESMRLLDRLKARPSFIWSRSWVPIVVLSNMRLLVCPHAIFWHSCTRRHRRFCCNNRMASIKRVYVPSQLHGRMDGCVRPQVWRRILFFRVKCCEMPCACGWVCPSLMEVDVRCAHMRTIIVDTIV